MPKRIIDQCKDKNTDLFMQYIGEVSALMADWRRLNGQAEGNEVLALLTHSAEVMADFRCRMPAMAAERALNLKTDTVRGAMERREIRYIRRGKTQRLVTPMMLAEWIERYLTVPADPLPGGPNEKPTHA